VTAAVLDVLAAAGAEDDDLTFEILPACAAAGEHRIGYASIMRLVECVREMHWRRDVLPAAAGRPVDSITRTLSADFSAPMEINDRVAGRYRVAWCRRRSYGLEVSFSSRATGACLARIDLVNVFYDPVRRRSTTPPDAVLEALRATSGAHPRGSGSDGLTSRKPTVR